MGDGEVGFGRGEVEGGRLGVDAGGVTRGRGESLMEGIFGSGRVFGWVLFLGLGRWKGFGLRDGVERKTEGVVEILFLGLSLHFSVSYALD